MDYKSFEALFAAIFSGNDQNTAAIIDDLLAEAPEEQLSGISFATLTGPWGNHTIEMVFDYLKKISLQQLEPSDRVFVAFSVVLAFKDKALTHSFLDALCQRGEAFDHIFLKRAGELPPATEFDRLPEGDSLLHAAIDNDVVLSTLLSIIGKHVGKGKAKRIINMPDRNGDTPLHRAAYQRQLEATALLLKHGADVSQRNLKQQLPIHSIYGVDAGIAFQGIGFHSIFSNLWKAMQKKHTHSELEEIMVEPVIGGGNWLHIMAAYGDSDLYKEVLPYCDDIDAKNHNGDTALSIAAMALPHEIFDNLLARGAEVNTRNQIGETPLTKALHSRHWQRAQYLLEQGAKVAPADVALLRHLDLQGENLIGCDFRHNNAPQDAVIAPEQLTPAHCIAELKRFTLEKRLIFRRPEAFDAIYERSKTLLRQKGLPLEQRNLLEQLKDDAEILYLKATKSILRLPTTERSRLVKNLAAHLDEIFQVALTTHSLKFNCHEAKLKICQLLCAPYPASIDDFLRGRISERIMRGCAEFIPQIDDNGKYIIAGLKLEQFFTKNAAKRIDFARFILSTDFDEQLIRNAHPTCQNPFSRLEQALEQFKAKPQAKRDLPQAKKRKITTRSRSCFNLGKAMNIDENKFSNSLLHSEKLANIFAFTPSDKKGRRRRRANKIGSSVTFAGIGGQQFR